MARISLENTQKTLVKECEKQQNESYFYDVCVLCCRDIYWSEHANQFVQAHPFS